MNNGYTNFLPVQNDTWLNWANWTVASSQKTLDADYMHGSGNSLDHYYAMADAWISTETRLRDASPDPEHYAPVTPLPVIPIRQIADWDSDKGFFNRPAPVDTSIPVPALGAYVKPVSLPLGITGAGVLAEKSQQEMILGMLAQLLADTSAIKAKLAKG